MTDKLVVTPAQIRALEDEIAELEIRLRHSPETEKPGWWGRIDIKRRELDILKKADIYTPPPRKP